ncbi:MAG: Mur ligase family protein [Bacteroidota bacterium]
MEGFRVIAVAGTHGKTTTSALLAHILTITGKSVSCFVGGVMKGYDSNYISGTSDWVVVEADEYDRSFLRLTPEVVVIQAMDADHLDIYGSHDMMLQAYRELTLRIRPAGTLWIESTTAHDYLTYDWKTELSDREVQIRTFGIESGDVRAEDVTVYNDSARFKVFGEPNYTFSLTIPGDYNIRNALASIGVASSFDLRYGEMASALSSFEGLERRYEKVGSGDDWVLISDYAHHPIELRSVIRATRELYPNQHLTVVFEPHLYTRTRDFLNEFALELGRADTVILVELYPAREKPIVGINSQALLDQIDMISKRLVSKNDIVDALSASSDGVILLLGAGDLYKYQGDILDRLEERDKSMR